MERIEGLHARGRAIQAAALVGYAIGDGKALTREHDGYLASLRALPGAEPRAPGALSEADEDTIAYIIGGWGRGGTHVARLRLPGGPAGARAWDGPNVPPDRVQ